MINFYIFKLGDQIFVPPTPHINSKKSSFAKTVRLPEEPKKAKYEVEKFLENHKLVNYIPMSSSIPLMLKTL